MPVLDDAVDEGSETFTLRLSDASGAGIADGTATGTIENSDPLQKMWLSRFGRTVAGQVVEAVTGRLSGPPDGLQVTLGGQSIGLSALSAGTGGARRTLAGALGAERAAEGLRHDGGDAETGTGVEVGGRISYTDAGSGLTVEANARTLVAHEDSGYREWGAGGSVRLDPGASGRGLSLTLAPVWGTPSSGVERLWSARDAAGLAPGGDFEATRRLNVEIGYGLGAPRGLGLVTPYARLSLADGGALAGCAGRDARPRRHAQ